MSLYEILKLKPNATLPEIKKSYRELARVWHPDKCKDFDSTERFQKIKYAYEILSNEKTRTKYHTMNNLDKTNFENLLNKVFNKNLKINELKAFGVELSPKDFKYLDNNFSSLINKLNLVELLKLFNEGILTKKDNISSDLCSDSDVNIWNSDQAQYYYNLPVEFQKINKNNITLNLNIQLEDIMYKKQRKIKICRKLNNKNINTTFVFNINHPYIVFNGGGDINNNIGNLIIKLTLQKGLLWEENMIVYEHNITLYQMIYGASFKINLGIKNIEINSWTPIRDGYLIELDDIDIDNNSLAIRLILDYKHTENKEMVLKNYFN